MQQAFSSENDSLLWRMGAAFDELLGSWGEMLRNSKYTLIAHAIKEGRSLLAQYWKRMTQSLVIPMSTCQSLLFTTNYTQLMHCIVLNPADRGQYLEATRPDEFAGTMKKIEKVVSAFPEACHVDVGLRSFLFSSYLTRLSTTPNIILLNPPHPNLPLRRRRWGRSLVELGTSKPSRLLAPSTNLTPRTSLKSLIGIGARVLRNTMMKILWPLIFLYFSGGRLVVQNNSSAKCVQ